MDTLSISTDQKVVGSNPAECTNFSLRKLRRNPSVYLTLGQKVSGEAGEIARSCVSLGRQPSLSVRLT